MEVREAFEQVYKKASMTGELNGCPSSFRFSQLTPPDEMMRYINGNKNELREHVFGIGGFEYIERRFQEKRAMVRISFNVYKELMYQELGTMILPLSTTDWMEGLTQMEYQDAVDAFNVLGF